MTRHVLICDDDEERRHDWQAELEELLDGQEWKVDTLDEKGFQDVLDNLVARQLGMGPRGDGPPDLLPQLARADVLVVDYDLRFFKRGISGEEFCYLARCFSTVKTILGVNRDRINTPFYLTLQDPMTSFADVNIGEAQTANPWLWGRERDATQAAPWYWPDLTRLTDDFDARVQEAGDALDCKVLDFLGLSDAPVPAVLLAYLDPNEGTESTLRTLAHDSALGLRGKDVEVKKLDVTGRVVAARLAKWVRCLAVVQDVLIDAPHLVDRFPGVLGAGPATVTQWQALARREVSGAGLLPALVDFEFARPAWADRPLWRMGDLYNSDLPAVAAPWNAPEPPADLVFAEDVSTFVDRHDARGFSPQLPGGSPVRWVLADRPEIYETYPGAANLDYYPADYFAR